MTQALRMWGEGVRLQQRSPKVCVGGVYLFHLRLLQSRYMSQRARGGCGVQQSLAGRNTVRRPESAAPEI